MPTDLSGANGSQRKQQTAVVTVQLMEHGSATLLLLLVLAVSSWQVGGGRPRVPAILVFGDSIVDTGNNNAVLTLTKSDFRPYGKDLNGGVPTGRFSNGRIPPDFLASRLGLKDLVPAYLGTDLTDDDLLTGVSFASGGTGYDPLTSTLVAVLPMQEELNMFAEYKEKLAGVVGDEAAARIIAESLFLVCAGTDDIANNYYLAPVRQLQYDISAYVDFLVQQASDFMKQLYQQGARRIAILGLPPIGCVPSQRTVAGGLARSCDPARNRAAQQFNSKLKEEIRRLQKELQCQRIGYVDIYDVLQDMITDPCKYGFDVSSRGCCGTGDFEVSLLCNQVTATTCPDDRKYVFWDSFHPTERAYEIMVDYLYPRYVEKLL
ncbi:GDSL esterase/lipase EXL3-like [Phragmites australis]|uniref:GDSL esterase/lipase EXL3-like n=1 Tax=Phragmites australis TaxID=29695 RepID=UPI002D77A6C4|nr:GDSL esterase/lipase EXL3-like [Phragmites australis]